MSQLLYIGQRETPKRIRVRINAYGLNGYLSSGGIAAVESAMRSSRRSPLRYPHVRKYRRFALRFPVSLAFSCDGVARELEGFSMNVSLGGVLIKAEDHIPLQTQVSLKLSVVGPQSRRPVRLQGAGEVVRVDSGGSAAGFTIAVKCSQPITEMASHLGHLPARP